MMPRELYMVWTVNGAIVGEAEVYDGGASVQPTSSSESAEKAERLIQLYKTISTERLPLSNPARIYGPLLFGEQVQPDPGGRRAQVKVGLAPITASIFLPWIDARWTMSVPVAVTEKAEQLVRLYEKISTDLRVQATSNLVVVGPNQMPSPGKEPIDPLPRTFPGTRRT